MKLIEFEQLVNSTKFPNTTFRFKCGNDFYANCGGILVTMKVKDVDSGEPVEVNFGEQFTLRLIEAFDKKEATRFIYEQLRRLWIHELDEFFEVDGEKVYYPHRRAA